MFRDGGHAVYGGGGLHRHGGGVEAGARGVVPLGRVVPRGRIVARGQGVVGGPGGHARAVRHLVDNMQDPVFCLSLLPLGGGRWVAWPTARVLREAVPDPPRHSQVEVPGLLACLVGAWRRLVLLLDVRVWTGETKLETGINPKHSPMG